MRYDKKAMDDSSKIYQAYNTATNHYTRSSEPSVYANNTQGAGSSVGFDISNLNPDSERVTNSQLPMIITVNSRLQSLKNDESKI